MPTYEYECNDCGGHFEKFQQMSAEPVKKCPDCGGKVRRLIGSGGAVIMKGSRASNGPRCGKDVPCCGRDSVCDMPSCGQ